MQANLLILWITLIPFITWGGFYESPKVFVFFVGLIFIFIHWVWQFLANKYVFDISKVGGLFLLWILLLFISALLSNDPRTTILGGGYRHQGALFFFGLFILGKTISVLPSHKKTTLGKSVAIAMIVQGIVVMAQVVAGNVYFDRPISTIGEVNALAGMLAIGSYFIYNYLPNIFLLFCFVSILLSTSKSGILTMFTLTLLTLTKNNKIYKKIALAVLFLATLTFGYFSLNSNNNSLFENRIVIWRMGITSTLKKPLLGYGPENGSYVYEKSYAKLGVKLQDFQIDRAHNLFLDVTLWSGYLGLFVFIYFLFRVYKSVNVDKKIAIFTFLVYSAVQPLSIVHWILFIVFLNV